MDILLDTERSWDCGESWDTVIAENRSIEGKNYLHVFLVDGYTDIASLYYLLPEGVKGADVNPFIEKNFGYKNYFA